MVPKFEFVPAAARAGAFFSTFFLLESPALGVTALPRSCEENPEEEESNVSTTCCMSSGEPRLPNLLGSFGDVHRWSDPWLHLRTFGGHALRVA
jgi:hypothetical protein